MGLTNRKSKVYNHSYYKSNKEKVLQEHKSNAGKIKQAKSAWYKKNLGKILHAQQNNYACNPNDKKEMERERYASQPELKRKLKRESYMSQPEPKRMKERERYASQPESKRTNKRVCYASEPEPKKAKEREWYASQPEAKRTKKRECYASEPEPKKAKERERYASEPEPKKAKERERYASQPEAKRTKKRECYASEPEPKKAKERERYASEPEPKKAKERERYASQPEAKRTKKRERYASEPEPKKAKERERYASQPEPKKAADSVHYACNLQSRKMSMQKRYGKCRSQVLLQQRCAYYGSALAKAAARVLHRATKCMKRKAQAQAKQKHSTARSYSLHEPNQLMREHYVKLMARAISIDASLKKDLVSSFVASNLYDTGKMKASKLANAVSHIAVRKVLSKILKQRKICVGEFLMSVRKVNDLQISVDNFGQCFHTASSEPYFYEESYFYQVDGCIRQANTSARFKEQIHQLRCDPCLNDRDCKDSITRLENNRGDDNCCHCKECKSPIVVDELGRCNIAVEIGQRDSKTQQPSKWQCTSLCKLPTMEQRQQIVNLKAIFTEQVHNLRRELNHVDSGCYNTHETCTLTGRELAGHPSKCITSGCESKLRILRAASPHYPMLRRFLSHLYAAIRSHKSIDDIDTVLRNGDFKELSRLCGFTNYQNMFGIVDIAASDQPAVQDEPVMLQQPQLPGLESELFIDHADMISQLEKQLADDPEFACCCCERLLQRKNVTAFQFSESKKFTSDTWEILKGYMFMSNPDATKQTHYICQYCRPILNRNKMPNRCVLNGLEVEPVPQELQNLDPLSKQLIQRGKAFQAIYRLGTYTGNVPSHNSLKACKGTMFFLPLPLDKTVQTLEEVENKAKGVSAGLPNPELYIIVNSKSKTKKTVWQSLINVDSLKNALRTLRDINWLYANVDADSLDDSFKKIVESVSETSSIMLQKVSNDDVSTYQSYTIRRLDQKESSMPDTDQYKLANVSEDALSNRLKFLDVLCFPTLFPSGKFGESHDRDVRISPSEIVKSCLLHKDARFRKDDQYVFYLLWQKEMRELQAGVYSLLKSTRKHALPVGEFMDRVNGSDEQVEGNLSTIFQNVRGSKQYWYRRNSELMCMVRELGPPTFFLTLSCAEYESVEIDTYLRKVNDVSDRYPTAKLCTEDPLSVSRKFSQKFHDFFNTVLLKGAALGDVTEYFYKKEYQSRGAPHYHILLWIQDAPIAGRDDDDVVLEWVQQRITCHVPEEDSNPELHRLVTKYQYHKCNKYCQRKKRVKGGTFITRCRFGFPRETCESATLFSVDECMKLAHRKLYKLPRSPEEIRINNYNPLLLLLWKANMDLQYIGESSLAIARYVTGYVTKAERSNMQDLWQEVSSHESIYSKLWSFGIRSLRSRECGLYEASDLLLGDHLCGKSKTVKWIDVSRPHNRKRRLRDHSKLAELREIDPNSMVIFEDNIIDTFYPQRPRQMEGICLYEFVSEYTKNGVDADGNIVYRKLTKPVLPNHKIYNPNRENERESYYYSLLLLFVPFRNEGDLIEEGENAESAFNRHVEENASMNTHSQKLQQMLQSKECVKKINEARQAQEDNEKQPQPLEEDDCPQVAGEAKSAMNDVLDLHHNDEGDGPSLEELVASLNTDQSRVFKRVKSHLEHQALHEKSNCKCTDFKPLHMFVSGVGGTGKSFLIKTIRALVSDIWDCKVQSAVCAVTAPTGLAAFNVGGVTIHRLLQLPIEHEGRAAGYWKLGKDALKVMRASLSQLRLLIIDEVSMVSNLNLAYIHLRLDEIFARDEWFGGVNVLFVGDILQLPPVNGGAVFERINNKSIVNKLGCMTSINIWQECVDYDELTINERQKKDQMFSSMLDEVRRGCVSDNTLQSLQNHVITTPVVEKFEELLSSKQSPLCLFPTRKSCEQFNIQMLSRLAAETKAIPCIDEVDETLGTYKWNDKAADALQKLNSDCNLTAGLEAVLKVAVGARVMLRRNIDTATGLINGAVGTVTEIKTHHITVQFDGRDEPHHVERVKSRFVVLKKLYVHRKQFPLILAFAVTVHKCQGLSLDCAIMDLSDQVFCPGMAYVALSRVRRLENLHLISFKNEAIKVSSKCLDEINRLRKTYRPDLPQYTVQRENKSTAKKRKQPPLTGVLQIDAVPKRVKVSTVAKKQKRSVDASKKTAPPKKIKKGTVVRIRVRQPVLSVYRYNPVSPDWQRRTCERLGLHFVCNNGCTPGGPDVPLTYPKTAERMLGDGNCLFRAFAYTITGSQREHFQLRCLVVEHMRWIVTTELEQHLYPNFITDDDTIEDYIVRTHMHQDGTWGSDKEIHVLCHLLRVNVVSFNVELGQYSVTSPGYLEPDTYAEDHSRPTIYVVFVGSNHFNVELS